MSAFDVRILYYRCGQCGIIKKGRVKIKSTLIKKIKNMMDYNMMNGASGGGMILFSWITYILVIALLISSIVALWKYIKKQ